VSPSTLSKPTQGHFALPKLARLPVDRLTARRATALWPEWAEAETAKTQTQSNRAVIV